MSGIDAEYKAKLAHMAGQIADFFKAYPEEQAVHSIADHINQFWSPRMRADFLTACRDGSITPHPLAGKAAGQIRSSGTA